MKTLRETLLARHHAATPKLDEIRRATVSEFNTKTQSSPDAKGAGAATLLQNLWRELVWPCRRTWAGLAAAWLLIVGGNLADSDGQPTAATTVAERRETRMAYQEQKEILDELIGASASATRVKAIVPRRPDTRPRSQVRITVIV